MSLIAYIKNWVIVEETVCNRDIFANVDGIYKEICNNLKNKNLADGIGYLGFIVDRNYKASISIPLNPLNLFTSNDYLIIHKANGQVIKIKPEELNKYKTINDKYNFITNTCAKGAVSTTQTQITSGEDITKIPTAVGYSGRKCGEAGLMQLMPGTALQYGAFTDSELRISKIYKDAKNVNCDETYGNDLLNYAQGKTLEELKEVDDRFDIKKNVFAGTNYLSKLLQRYNGNYNLALAAYNAGETKVDEAIKNPECINNINKCNLPDLTKTYVNTIIQSESQFK